MNETPSPDKPWAERHPSTQHMLKWFEFSHLPDRLQPVSASVARVAYSMVDNFPDSPELTAGLRKLLEAKDCFVRAAVDKDPGYWTDR